MAHLGYPRYFLTILGTWKILGAIVVCAPRLPRLKEWAYAGMIFDLTGAAASRAFMGDGAPMVVVPLAIAAVVLASWSLRPSSRRLESPRSLVGGAMCCGLTKTDFMVRVGREGYDDALAQPHARPMDFTGRPLRGMVYVDPAGIRTEAALTRWVQRGVAFLAASGAAGSSGKRARPAATQPAADRGRRGRAP
jgi:hypothetical protein